MIWYWVRLWLGAGLLLSLVLVFFRTPDFWRAYFFKDAELVQLPGLPIYVSPQMPAEERGRLVAHYQVARRRVEQLWGGIEAAPVLVVAATARGRHSVFAPHAATTYISPLGTYILLQINGYNPDVLAHELCHAELAQRVGWRKRKQQIPTWFDEGLAMLLDERFPDWYDELSLMSQGHMPDLEALATEEQFFGGDQVLFHYFVAKKIVLDWYLLHKKEGLLRFVKQIRDGERFDAVFAQP